MSKSAWMQDQQGNFSNDKNDTFDPAKGYVGIRLQQGVPLLDRDWNELEDIRRYEMMSLRKNYVGNGSPDDGFRIAAADPASSDFKIMAGRCLVDGFEAVNKPSAQDHIFYSEQPAAPALTVPADPTDPRVDTAYLDVWIEEVRSAGGSDPLQNPQDLGVETCVRHKLNWIVRVDEGKAGYTPEDFHRYYPIAEIEWADGVIVKATDIRGSVASLKTVNRDLEKLRHAVLDAWIEGGDVVWTNTANNVYSLAIQPAVCMINGKEVLYGQTTSPVLILPGRQCIVVATGDGRILTMDGAYLTLSRWLADWFSYGKFDVSKKYIPLYVFERPTVDAALTKTDLREGGAFDVLIAAVEEIDKKVAVMTGEQRITIAPIFNKYGTNPEWACGLNMTYKPSSATISYAYGLIPLNLPSGARITKFRACGNVPSGNSLNLYLGAGPVNSTAWNWFSSLYASGAFDISVGPYYNITNQKCFIYAFASGTGQIDLYGIEITYVMQA
jgi:hypothetical protein